MPLRKARPGALRGISEVAHPKGPILATIPVTNPTSTTIFKTLICLKTRNPVIFSPHRGARKCIKETARILAEAAQRAGAPEHAVQSITRSQSEYVERLMRHPTWRRCSSWLIRAMFTFDATCRSGGRNARASVASMTTAINAMTKARLIGGLLSSVGARTREGQVVIGPPYTDADPRVARRCVNET